MRWPPPWSAPIRISAGAQPSMREVRRVRAAADARAVDVDVDRAVAADRDHQVDEAPGRAGRRWSSRREPEVMMRTWPLGVRSIRKPTSSPPLAVFQSQIRRYELRGVDLDLRRPRRLAQVAERRCRRAQVARAGDARARARRARGEVGRGAAGPHGRRGRSWTSRGCCRPRSGPTRTAASASASGTGRAARSRARRGRSCALVSARWRAAVGAVPESGAVGSAVVGAVGRWIR